MPENPLLDLAILRNSAPSLKVQLVSQDDIHLANVTARMMGHVSKKVSGPMSLALGSQADGMRIALQTLGLWEES